MNRRGFLGLFGAGVAGIALDAAIPFNRVWSFASKVVVPVSSYEDYVNLSDMALVTTYYDKAMIETLKSQISRPFHNLIRYRPLPGSYGKTIELFSYQLSPSNSLSA